MSRTNCSVKDRNASPLARPILRGAFATERPYQTYRQNLTEAAMRAGERLGWKIRRERAAFLPESCRPGNHSPTPITPSRA